MRKQDEKDSIRKQNILNAEGQAYQNEEQQKKLDAANLPTCKLLYNKTSGTWAILKGPTLKRCADEPSIPCESPCPFFVMSRNRLAGEISVAICCRPMPIKIDFKDYDEVVQEEETDAEPSIN